MSGSTRSPSMARCMFDSWISPTFSRCVSDQHRLSLLKAGLTFRQVEAFAKGFLLEFQRLDVSSLPSFALSILVQIEHRAPIHSRTVSADPGQQRGFERRRCA